MARPRMAKEVVQFQFCMTPGQSAMLERMAEQGRASKAEVLRRALTEAYLASAEAIKGA